eukprot:911854-Karenia_brevis.AAC.1
MPADHLAPAEHAALDFDNRRQSVQDWLAKSPVERCKVLEDGSRPSHPGHAIQQDGGLADFWYMDDGTVICDPRLVASYLRSFDHANSQLIGASRNISKSHVILYATKEQISDNE